MTAGVLPGAWQRLPLDRGLLLLLALLALLTAGAWALTVQQARTMGRGSAVAAAERRGRRSAPGARVA